MCVFLFRLKKSDQTAVEPSEIVVLFCLQINQITVVEADAILLCVHKVRQKSVPSDISPGKVTTRSIVVSHLYSRIHNTVLACFKFVGLEQLIVSNFQLFAKCSG